MYSRREKFIAFIYDIIRDDETTLKMYCFLVNAEVYYYYTIRTKVLISQNPSAAMYPRFKSNITESTDYIFVPQH